MTQDINSEKKTKSKELGRTFYYVHLELFANDVPPGQEVYDYTPWIDGNFG